MTASMQIILVQVLIWLQLLSLLEESHDRILKRQGSTPNTLINRKSKTWMRCTLPGIALFSFLSKSARETKNL